MFNDLFGDVYRWIRERSDMNQEDVASACRVSRATVHRWETGASNPAREKEARLMSTARVTRERFVELVCERLSRYLGRRVAVAEEKLVGYEPSSAILRAETLLRVRYGAIPVRLRKALQTRINSARTVGFLFEQDLLELEELVEACLETQGDAGVT